MISFLKEKIKKISLNKKMFLMLCLILILNILYFVYAKDYPNTDKEITLWHPFLTSLFLIMVLGFSLNFIGNKVPFLNKFGLGFILCILVPSYLMYSDILGSSAKHNINFFAFNKKDKISQGIDFSKIFIVIIVLSSILSIEFKLLKKVILKFILFSLLSVFISFIVVGLLGYLLNYRIPSSLEKTSRNSFIDALFFISSPLTNGGVNLGVGGSSGGAYKDTFGQDKDEKIKSILLVPVIIARIFSIILSGMLYYFLDKTKFSGQGQLQKQKKNSKIIKNKKIPLEYQNIGIGLLIVLGFYSLGNMINHFLSVNHIIKLDDIVYIIILALIVQFFDLLPKEYKNYLLQIGKIMTVNFTAPVLVLLGLTTNFQVLIDHIVDYRTILLVLFSLLTTISCSFLLASLFNLYHFETSLVVGISSHSIGSTGNVGVMTVSNRMELLSFAMIITRIIGSIVFILSNSFVSTFYS
ncbi:2-hydroxycarboxylate transporter family protein ['Camptotheca acuminata' phytoplasma]|uniref:2-hydroxycarboxylate transporter family protein n=1 Tax='Camptotheca acuminata' phytoplasma TaxID=3239192 RepID=UPI003519F3C8